MRRTTAPKNEDDITSNNFAACLMGLFSQYGKVNSHCDVLKERYTSWKTLGASYLEALTSTPENGHKKTSTGSSETKRLSAEAQGLAILVNHSLRIDQEIGNLQRILSRLQIARALSRHSLGCWSFDDFFYGVRGLIENLTSEYSEIREELMDAGARSFRTQE